MPSTIAGLHHGPLGRNVLTRLEALPSSLYRSALGQWRVRVSDSEDDFAARSWRSEADEPAEPAPGMRNIPALPPGFHDSADTLAVVRRSQLALRAHAQRRPRIVAFGPGACAGTDNSSTDARNQRDKALDNASQVHHHDVQITAVRSIEKTRHCLI